jgi:hypothetical protein
LIGLGSALFTAFAFHRPGFLSDFEYWWRAARMLLAGGNPYHMTPETASWPLENLLLYPLPTLLLTVPLAGLSPPVAGAIFMGISGGLLAWLVSRDGLWRLWLFGSASYFMACRLGQWSPLIMAVAFVPAAGFLAAMKPNLGLSLLAYRPTWRATLGCAVVGLVSFAVLPSWLADWRVNVSYVSLLVPHPAPITLTGGPIVLLALLKWRRSEARLLLVMACVPQLLFWADQLPLFLIPRTKGEMKALVFWGALCFFVWKIWFEPHPAYVLARNPFVFCAIYLPCLIMVLRRPNEGDLPEWIERRLPTLMRSRRPPSTGNAFPVEAKCMPSLTRRW